MGEIEGSLTVISKLLLKIQLQLGGIKASPAEISKAISLTERQSTAMKLQNEEVQTATPSPAGATSGSTQQGAPVMKLPAFEGEESIRWIEGSEQRSELFGVPLRREVEKIDDVKGKPNDMMIAKGIENEYLNLTEEQQGTIRKVKEEDDANVDQKLRVNWKRKRHRKKRKDDPSKRELYSPGGVKAKGGTYSFEPVSDLEIEGFLYVCLLNLSQEIGCSNIECEKVVAATIRFNIAKELTGPVSVLVSVDEFESLLSRSSKELDFDKRVSSILVELGNQFKSLTIFFPNAKFTDVESAPYPIKNSKWNSPPFSRDFWWRERFNNAHLQKSNESRIVFNYRRAQKYSRMKYLISSLGIEKFRVVVEGYDGKSFEPCNEWPKCEFTSYSGWRNQGHVICSGDEEKTEWGEGVSWIYGSVTEHILNGFQMHCHSWYLVYCMLKSPAFNGSAPINLVDHLRRVFRWVIGSVEIFLSKQCRVWYGYGRGLKWLERFSYIHSAVYSWTSLSLIIDCTLPDIGLLNEKFTVPENNNYAIIMFTDLYITIAVTGGIDEWGRDKQFWVIIRFHSQFFYLFEGLHKVLAGHPQSSEGVELGVRRTGHLEDDATWINKATSLAHFLIFNLEDKVVLKTDGIVMKQNEQNERSEMDTNGDREPKACRLIKEGGGMEFTFVDYRRNIRIRSCKKFSSMAKFKLAYVA